MLAVLLLATTSALADPPTDATPGYHLTIRPSDAGKLEVALLKGDEPRRTTSIDPLSQPTDVRLRRRGATIEALVGDALTLSFDDDAPLPGGKVGLTYVDAPAQVANLEIASANVIDSTFRAAPTDWRITHGDWRVRSRWACTPRWSWFDGRDPELAAIWTRASFDGDVVAEIYAGMPMDQPWAPFYQHPSNYCITLCAHDATPGTGYSFVFAGWGNRASGIFRRGELVANTPGIIMPDILDSFGGEVLGARSAWQLHNDWWRIRAERIGGVVRFFVDGRLAGEFDDPDPLPGGVVGVWALENGITVARARVYYQRATAPKASRPPAVRAPASRRDPPRPSTESFESGPGGWGPATVGA